MALPIESELIESAMAGGAGLERLIERVWPDAYRIALSILQDRGLAEDAAQDACASIARSLSSLKNASVFRSWSYKIILNRAITTARRQPKTCALDALADRAVHFEDNDALDLYNALATLPFEQRAAIVLHYYGGLKSGEIAAATGLPSFTIVPPAGLPDDITSATVLTSAQGLYNDATKSWHVGDSFVTFAYKRAGGREFMLTAQRYDPKAELPGGYMLEAKDLPDGSVLLIKHAKFAWHNGDQVISLTEGAGITATEIKAIRAAMHGVALQTIDPKARRPGHDVKFMRIPKP